MLGSSILRILKKKGYKKIITADRKKLDQLRNPKFIRKFLKQKPDITIMLLLKLEKLKLM